MNKYVKFSMLSREMFSEYIRFLGLTTLEEVYTVFSSKLWVLHLDKQKRAEKREDVVLFQ